MIEPNALSDVISATELASLGAERIQYSQAVSLKRIADAVEELTVIASAPQPRMIPSDPMEPNQIFDDLPMVGANPRLHEFTFRTKMPESKWRKLSESPEGRTTSPEMASLAAKYMGMDDNLLLRSIYVPEGTDIDFPKLIDIFDDLRSLAASVLSQRADE